MTPTPKSHMFGIFSAAALITAAFLLLLGPAPKPEPATETSTTINYQVGQSGTAWLNLGTQLTLSSTEQNIVFQVTPGYPVYVQFAPPATSANSWTYSTVTGSSTQTTTVVGGQVLKLKFAANTTLYVASTSGVTLSISCLDYDIRAQ